MTVIFMTGAPQAADLDWNDQHLSPHFVARTRRYLQAESQDETTQDTLTATTHPLAKWRDVPLKEPGARRQPALKPNHVEATQFLSFLENPASQEHMRFLEHSLAVLQNLDSSQINGPDDTTFDESVHATDAASFSTSLSTNFSLQPSHASTYASESPVQQVVKFHGIVMDLKKIPSAHYLQSIHPQTMTINVLAGVISIQPARSVKLKKRTGEMDIVEILVGDETRAGFSVSFWFTPHESQNRKPSSSRDELRELLASIRIGDVLLITHIALHEFKNNVYGQSLSRRITKNNTSVIVLSESATGLPPPTAAKVSRVREWSANFVGNRTITRTTTPASRTTGDVSNQRLVLPPDSLG